MASISVNLSLFITISTSLYATLSSPSVIEDLKNLHPPPDFNSTIYTNCFKIPSLRYCNSSSPMNLDEIFKSTIVASHLCNESKNPNCVESFPKVDLRNRPMIAPLYLSFTFFWKYCPLTILSIDLSNTSLKGNFPVDVLQCAQIRVLDLSRNELSGDVPVESFSPLTNLTVLNLSYNRFTESKISNAQFFKRFNSSSFLHSGLLPDQKKFRIKLVALLVGFPIFVILMIGWSAWLCLRRPDFLPRMLQKKHRFTPPMLRAATNGFSKKNLELKSEAVDIYKGTLRDGIKVRIEIYRDTISRENRRKLIEECKVLVRLRHKNIVQVLGWCNNRRLRAIVTEWVEGENVEMWLMGSNRPWKQRLRILMGVVEGVCYLEETWPEVGYDLRTNSVLLSDNLEPLISRFKVGDQNSSKRKIYKLGVFLLEIISNRRPQEEFEKGETGFIEHVRTHYPGNIQNLMDEKMKMTEVTFDQAKRAIGLGLMCTDQSNQQLSFSQIYDITSKVCNHKRSHPDRRKGNKQVQPR
ncbi:hypothetical protein FNV43_RR06287 [Rhamnella rubrinervis]|uniref:Protein kinase domain-containing protein n=1 Tax=Rhamnella rubrinervis TaxID=2594499 RepID=A0A8K0HCS5_9ROSA|nr:hypothetical protein FNV43_RR06287 [Rhamnella rubrinervis]